MPIKLIISFEDSRKRGVYRIDFRERFYVGCADWVLSRMKQHARMINKLLAGAPMTPANDYYCHIVSHIQKYPEITQGVVSILEEVPRSENIFAVEKKWIKSMSGGGMCLNSREIQYWTEEEIEGLKKQFNL
jgi:hypothetical protein